MTPRERILILLVSDLALWLLGIYIVVLAGGMNPGGLLLLALYLSILSFGGGFWLARFRTA